MERIADRIRLIAGASLRTNLRRLGSGTYLSAGNTHFSSLWTRDFCFSVRGLLLIGEERCVRDHLERLLVSRRADGLIPRVLDCVAPQIRVSASLAGGFLGESWRRMSVGHPLRPEYRDEHGTEAIDSNALVILACADYRDHTGDWKWWDQQVPALTEVVRFYDSKIRDDGG